MNYTVNSFLLYLIVTAKHRLKTKNIRFSKQLPSFVETELLLLGMYFHQY